MATRSPATAPAPALLEDPDKLRQRYLLSLLLGPPKSKRSKRR